ncbi:energy-coupling factor transporter transmembrane component T [Corynebacterium cystitidis]|uniref:Energy-coupling factor transport system permease protein n=1 Tax=Corynebacterium cystitidis DSM 20524 TaxID=1121357 RepID=A0A1H9RE08_9CORY|nr:energy-coupling factor transporter transmembrane component T [Corynebacterium cystitidis]WJY81487.1 Energy-coupling factor transporter transmembrane protein EcfT [Corynebacterium cystitidis DSM 20524]SER70193.1 energy-coupling factor transport system permease protein [Corynebacterium cystitidis DSM 20524]SNV87021.1 ABC transporter permease [Corynebacterium cystitidis]
MVGFLARVSAGTDTASAVATGSDGNPNVLAGSAIRVVPDFRVGLLLILIFAAATSLLKEELALAGLVTYVLVLLALFHSIKSSLIALVWYLLCLGIRWLCVLAVGWPLLPWLGILLTLIIHAYPAYLMVFLIFSITPMTQMMASLSKARVPGTFIVVAMVVYRYAPTLLAETRTIVQSSSLRHTVPAWRRWLSHPVRELEYVIVPVLMRSSRIADELSAVAMCKGLDPAAQRTAFVEPKIGWQDLLFLVVSIGVIAALKIGGGS